MSEYNDLTNHGGVYLILNVLDCKVYVGQAKNFNNRSHLDVLNQRGDTKDLQDDYDDKEKGLQFVYLVVVDKGKKMKKKVLNFYEKLYMTLMEDLGFSLYNIMIKREDRTIEQLERKKEYKEILEIEEREGSLQEEYERAKRAIVEDFRVHFNVSPGELINSDRDRREQALRYYVKQRLDQQNENLTLFKSDRLIFTRKYINEILGGEEKSIRSLDISEMFCSKAGNYIGDGIDQILNYETKTIKKYGYCLWTFANNAVSADTVRKCCQLRKMQGKDTYVLFHFTPSSVYTGNEAYNHSILKKDCAKALSPEELDFLNFEMGDKGQYMVPKEIDCTAAGASSANAFVLEEIFLAKEVIVQSELKKQYEAIGAYGTYSLDNPGQRSTFYVRLKDTQKEIDYERLLGEPGHREICFVGKLAAPFILKLECNKDCD